MNSWLNSGEAERLEDDSQWSATIEDLADLIEASKSDFTREHYRERASRAVSFVLGNMKRRGQIEDEFVNVKEATNHDQE